MVPGVPLNKVYASIKEVLEGMDTTILKHLPTTLGYALRTDSSSAKNITAASTDLIEAHEIYYLQLGLHNLPKPNNAKGDFETYSIQLAETVLIRPNAEAQVMTEIPRRYHDISYLLEEPDEEVDKENLSAKLAELGEKGVVRSARLRDR